MRLSVFPTYYVQNYYQAFNGRPSIASSNTTSRELLDTTSVSPRASLRALEEALRQTANLQSYRVYHSASKVSSVNKSFC